MAAKRPNDERSVTKPAKPGSPTGEWSLWVRVAISLAVVWHMAVVFLSPLSVPPTSPLVSGIAQSPYLRWYSDPLYLNHGYHFFGPDPPLGGQLIRYQVYGEDGRVIEEGEFPSLKEQWPRLWYHRHMMLADQMTGVGVYGDPRRDKELMLKAYGRHLLRKLDGSQVRLQSVYHESLHPADVRSGADPTDPRYYITPQSDPRRRGRNTWQGDDAQLYERLRRDSQLAELYDSAIEVVVRRSDLETPLLPPAPDASTPSSTSPMAEDISIGVGR